MKRTWKTKPGKPVVVWLTLHKWSNHFGLGFGLTHDRIQDFFFMTLTLGNVAVWVWFNYGMKGGRR